MPLLVSFEKLDAAALHELCAKELPEDEQLEFKQDLPSKTGRDAWYSGEKLGPHARDKILAEVVAFANTRGGHVPSFAPPLILAGSGGALMCGVSRSRVARLAVSCAAVQRDDWQARRPDPCGRI